LRYLHGVRAVLGRERYGNDITTISTGVKPFSTWRDFSGKVGEKRGGVSLAARARIRCFGTPF
jgi:hypothetical protein